MKLKRQKPRQSVADKYFGAFKVTDWPEDLDLDEFVVEAMKKVSKK
jgi:hypothetical protein